MATTIEKVGFPRDYRSWTQIPLGQPPHLRPKLTRGSRKKVLFLVARLLRPNPPPSLVLSGHIFFGFFFLEFQKSSFFLVGPLLVAGLLKKYFCCGFPKTIRAEGCVKKKLSPSGLL